MAIPIGDSFEVTKKVPNFTRDLFTSIEEMRDYPDRKLPDVFECNVSDTGKRYRYNVNNEYDETFGKWRMLEYNGSGATPISSSYDADTKKISVKYTDSTYFAVDVTSVIDETREYADKKTVVCDTSNITYSIEDETGLETVTYVKEGETVVLKRGTDSDGNIFTDDIEGTSFFYVRNDVDFVTVFNVRIVGGTKCVTQLGTPDYTELINRSALCNEIDDEEASEDDKEKVVSVYALKKLWERGGAGASSADMVSYEREGKDDWENVKDALDGIIDTIEYVAPKITSLTITPSETSREKGEKIPSVTLAWNYNKGGITSQSITKLDALDKDVRTATYDHQIDSDTTFTLSASDGKTSVSQSVSIKFYNRIYWGNADSSSECSSSFVLSLSNSALCSTYKGRSISFNAMSDSERLFIAVPSSWGTIATININGFDCELARKGTFDFTNSKSYSESYSVFYLPDAMGESGKGTI